MTTIRPGRLEWIEYTHDLDGSTFYVARGPFALDVEQSGGRWRWVGCAADREVADEFDTHLDAIAAAEEWAIEDTIARMVALGGGERAIRAERTEP